MVIKFKYDKTEIAATVAKVRIIPIVDLKDVVIAGRNSDGVNGLNWGVEAWRVGSISKLDSGRERHPVAIPSDADVILVQTLIAGGASGITQYLDNTECYTHVGITFSRSGGTDATSFVGQMGGRIEAQ